MILVLNSDEIEMAVTEYLEKRGFHPAAQNTMTLLHDGVARPNMIMTMLVPIEATVSHGEGPYRRGGT